MIIIGDKFYLCVISDFLWGGRAIYQQTWGVRKMVKIFIGNLPDGGLVGNDDVRPLFEAFGTVTECEVIKNYG